MPILVQPTMGYRMLAKVGHSMTHNMSHHKVLEMFHSTFGSIHTAAYLGSQGCYTSSVANMTRNGVLVWLTCTEMGGMCTA